MRCTATVTSSCSSAAATSPTRYRQTVFGALWVFVGPLVSAGLFSFVFGSVAELPSGGVPYFVFSYAGLLAWNFFSRNDVGRDLELSAATPA